MLTWLRYHSKKATVDETAQKTPKKEAITRRSKRPSRPQAFNRIFGEEQELRAQFDEIYPQYKNIGKDGDDPASRNEDGTPDPTNPPTKKDKSFLKRWNGFVTQKYNEATKEEKEQVEEYVEQWEKDNKEQRAKAKEEKYREPVGRTPADLHRYVSLSGRWVYNSSDRGKIRAIQSIHRVIQPVADNVSATTGLNVFVCLGGPMPDQGGRLGFIQ